MAKDLISRREELMDRVDQALNAAWPHRTGDRFVEEMKQILAKMTELAKEMEIQGINEVELSKTYSNVGQIYSDLAPSLGDDMLWKAKESYIIAEKYLENCDDENAMAKLNFNFANTLRQIDPNNLKFLQEAKRRFESAGKYFSVHNPQYMPQLKDALNSLNGLIALAPVSKKVDETIIGLNEISNEINSTNDTNKILDKLKEFKKKSGSFPGQIGEIYGVINTLSNHSNNLDKLTEIKQQLDQISSQLTGGSGESDFEESQIISALNKRLESDLGNGKVDEAGAKVIGDLIHQFGSTLSKGGDNIEDLLKKAQAFQEVLTAQFELTHYLSHGIPRPPQGSRAALLIELCWILRRFLMQEMSQTGKGAEEGQKILNLNIKSTQVDKHLYEAGINNNNAAKFELNELRPFSLEIRNLSARHYSMIAKPIWSVADVAVDIKSIFFSGLPEKENSISLKISKLGYTFSTKPQGHSFAESRWTQLRSAMTTIFDFRSVSGSDLAAITYELGIALTIGKPIVIIIEEDQTLPFDVEIKPVVMPKGVYIDNILIDAIEQSLYWTYPRPNGKPSLKTVNYALKNFDMSDASLYLKETLKLLKSNEEDFDPLYTDHVLKKAIDYLNDGKTMLIHPVFPPEYQKINAKRIFHVMPFGPTWATATRDQVRKTCKNYQVEYIRGDEAKDANIIQSIWCEIARASHIVADITDFNANVALELGIAHAIGLPTLIVGQNNSLSNLFPMIAKLRVMPYDKPAELDEIIGKFIV